MIAGLLTPDRGSIALDDRVLFDAAGRINVPPHRRGIGYVFQEGRLFPHLSVRQNLDYGRRMSGRAADPKEFERIVTLLEIGHLVDRRPRLLSGGERQRVAIARALAVDPQIVLMDEPFSALDLNMRSRMRGEMERIWQQTGKTVVFVTHDIDEALQLADRTIVLSNKPTRVLETIELKAARPRGPGDHDIARHREKLITLFRSLEEGSIA
jgi:ABC-type molybdate transport system ATPase subunit